MSNGNFPSSAELKAARIRRTIRTKSSGLVDSTAKSASGSFVWLGPRRERTGAEQVLRNIARMCCFCCRGIECPITGKSVWARALNLSPYSGPTIEVTRQPVASLSSNSRVAARFASHEAQTTCFAVIWSGDKAVHIVNAMPQPCAADGVPP